MITIYTDGASRGNPGPGGWGAIIMDDATVTEIGGRDTHTTNNKMELMAAIKALEHVSSGDTIVVHTDAEYVAKGMNQWIYDWQRRNWRTAAKKPVLNQELWKQLAALSQVKSIEWKHVAGHAGHELNERCDVIATSFADGQDIELFHGPKESYQYK